MPVATRLTAYAPQLLLMPGQQYVFLAISAGVTDQRKGQRVFVRPAELVNPGAFAVSRSFASGALNGNSIPSDCVGAPDITFAVMISIDVKRAVAPHCPNSAKRVGPCTSERSRTGA
jgi:hypothetical protein